MFRPTALIAGSLPLVYMKAHFELDAFIIDGDREASTGEVMVPLLFGSVSRSSGSSTGAVAVVEARPRFQDPKRVRRQFGSTGVASGDWRGKKDAKSKSGISLRL